MTVLTGCSWGDLLAGVGKKEIPMAKKPENRLCCKFLDILFLDFTVRKPQ